MTGKQATTEPYWIAYYGNLECSHHHRTEVSAKICASDINYFLNRSNPKLMFKAKMLITNERTMNNEKQAYKCHFPGCGFVSYDKIGQEWNAAHEQMLHLAAASRNAIIKDNERLRKALTMICEECECEVTSRIASKAISGETVTEDDSHFPKNRKKQRSGGRK